jgi:hypothetical protein
MSRTHLSDDDLIRRLYGLEDAAGGAHLAVCLECIRRWEDMRQRRGSVVLEADVPVDVLREQRLRIFDRLERAPAVKWRRVLVPAMAAALLIAAGLSLYRPKETPLNIPENAGAEFVDAGWYEDAYSDMQPVEPRAATPIRELFEEGAVTE